MNGCPVVVPDEHEVGQFGDPQLPGQQPRPAGGQPGHSDAARLDLERLEAGGHVLKLRAEGLTGATPVSVELNQRVGGLGDKLIELSPGLDISEGRLRLSTGAWLAEGPAA